MSIRWKTSKTHTVCMIASLCFTHTHTHTHTLDHTRERTETQQNASSPLAQKPPQRFWAFFTHCFMLFIPFNLSTMIMVYYYNWNQIFLKIIKKGPSLAVQWLRLCTSTAGGTGLIPGCKTKILHAVWQGQEINKRMPPSTKRICC